MRLANAPIRLQTTPSKQSLRLYQLKLYIGRVARYLPKTGKSPRAKEILVVLCGDKEIKKIKKIFWGKPIITDVISFYYEDPPLIEIIINVDQAKRQSPYPNTGQASGLIKEAVFLYIHGMLHILGYKDNSARKRKEMLDLGRQILEKVF